ncbi:MAG: dihydrolipoamide acetyltransferase family protein [Aggregatilineales bacterium]
MATEVTLTMDGMLLNWLKDVGDSVSSGEVIAEFDADKATVEVEAEADGTIVELKGEPGDEITEGTVIAVIGAAGEAPADSSDNGSTDAKAEAPADEEKIAQTQSAPTTSQNGAITTSSVTPDGRLKISPLARRIAADKGINPGEIQGTGPGGRIIKVDVENYTPPVKAAQVAAPAAQKQTYGKLPVESDDIEIVDVDRMRRAIADNTILSKQMTPHFYVTVEIDVAALLKLRKELNATLEEDGIKISVNDMVVKAAALTLKQYPNLNSHYYGDKIVRYKRINIGIAVALPNNGLMNVVSKDADITPLSVMAVKNKEMFVRAREGKVKPDDIRGATFTVSNLGPYAVDHFSAIINPPESGILAVSSAQKVPIVMDDGTLGIGNRMKVTISVDHRVSDGAEGAEYMRTFRSLIENPMRLLV